MDPRIRLMIINLVDDDLGIYPQSITDAKGVTKDRTEWQNGWNAAIKQIFHKRAVMADWYNKLDASFKDMIEPMLLQDILSINCNLKDEFGGEKDEITFFINTNDTFYYASADAEGVEESEIPAVYDAFKLFGWSGVLAWASIKRDMLPLKQLRTPEFKVAYRTLSKLSNQAVDSLFG